VCVLERLIVCSHLLGRLGKNKNKSKNKQTTTDNKQKRSTRERESSKSLGVARFNKQQGVLSNFKVSWNSIVNDVFAKQATTTAAAAVTTNTRSTTYSRLFGEGALSLLEP